MTKPIEGDATKIPVRLAAGPAKDEPVRPDKSTQLVFGGATPQSPWGQIAALVGEGGTVPYTLVSSAAIAKAHAKGRKPGSAPPPKKQDEQKPQPAPEPEAPDVHEAATADIYVRGEELKHGKEPARVWAHHDCHGLGPRPLVIYLHGIQRPHGLKYPQMQDHLEDGNVMHVGMLAKALIDDGKVEPLIIAAANCSTDGSSTTLWNEFTVAGFLEDLRPVLSAHGLSIDETQVAVVGHSGAGCNAKGGMCKVARDGAGFDGKPLKLFGLADTCMTAGAGFIIGDALGKLHTPTILYSMHRDQGGGGAYAGVDGIAKLFGARVHQSSPSYRPGEGPEIGDYRDDGEPEPKRISLKTTDVYAHEKAWRASGAIHAKGDRPNRHYAMVLNWTWAALQRFFPRVSPPQHAADALGAAGVHLATGVPPQGDAADVPAGPPPWTGSGSPQGNAPSRFADAASGRYWPVRTRSAYGRAVAYVAQDGTKNGGGPASDRTGQRQFLASRGGWFLAGVDLYADFGDPIVAPEAAVVAGVGGAGVAQVVLHCFSGLVIVLAGLDADSVVVHANDVVRGGQRLGTAGRAQGQAPAICFQTYPSGTQSPVVLRASGGNPGVLDPTAYLLALAGSGK